MAVPVDLVSGSFIINSSCVSGVIGVSGLCEWIV